MLHNENTSLPMRGPWTREHGEDRRSGTWGTGGAVGLEPTACRRRIGVADPPDEDRVRRRDRHRNPLPPVGRKACGRPSRRRCRAGMALKATKKKHKRIFFEKPAFCSLPRFFARNVEDTPALAPEMYAIFLNRIRYLFKQMPAETSSLMTESHKTPRRRAAVFQ